MTARRRARDRGKALEYRCARYWGGRRTPLSGSNSGHTGADIIHARLYVECKHAQTYATLWRWYDKAASASSWRGFVVVHDLAREQPTFIVCHSRDWQWVRERSVSEMAEASLPTKAGAPPWVFQRQGTGVGSLLWNVRQRAAEERKIPMLNIGLPGRKGFMIVVHGNDWDKAREVDGGS